MSARLRFWVYVAGTALTGFLLNGCAVMLVATGNGLPGLPSVFDLPLFLAYWPAWVCGYPREQWFYPDLLGPVALNIGGWISIGALAAVVTNMSSSGRKHWAAERRDAADEAGEG